MIKRRIGKNFILSLIVLGGIAIGLGGYTLLAQQKAADLSYVNDVSVQETDSSSADRSAHNNVQRPSDKPAKVNTTPDIVQDTGHLVYKDYGDKAVPVEQGSTIRLENIQVLLSEEEISGIFLYHFETQSVVKEFSADTVMMEYQVEEEGHYSIYAVTVNDETINLSKHVSVDHAVPGADGVQYNDEKNQSGFINLSN